MKIINIRCDEGNEVFVYKDLGMIPYSLARYMGYNATFAFLNDVQGNEDFEQYAHLLSMGNVQHIEKYMCIEVVKKVYH